MDNVYAVIENGQVVNVIVWDGDTDNWQPPEGQIAVDISEGSTAGIGYTYDGEVFTAPPVPPPTLAETLSINTAARDNYLASAARAIAPLQDAVDLESAMPEELALLKKWKQYRVDVNRIDLTQINPTWPNLPA